MAESALNDVAQSHSEIATRAATTGACGGARRGAVRATRAQAPYNVGDLCDVMILFDVVRLADHLRLIGDTARRIIIVSADKMLFNAELLLVRAARRRRRRRRRPTAGQGAERVRFVGALDVLLVLLIESRAPARTAAH